MRNLRQTSKFIFAKWKFLLNLPNQYPELKSVVENAQRFDYEPAAPKIRMDALFPFMTARKKQNGRPLAIRAQDKKVKRR